VTLQKKLEFRTVSNCLEIEKIVWKKVQTVSNHPGKWVGNAIPDDLAQNHP
jgi:hypothetical protein